MKTYVSFCLSFLFAVAVLAETALELPNAGFEDGTTGWSIPANEGMSTVIAEAARTGKLGLQVADTSNTRGSSCRSTALPVKPESTYSLRFWGRSPNGSGGVGVYLQFFDAKGKGLNTPDRRNELIVSVDGKARDWQEYTLVGQAPEGAATVSVWVHSFNSSTGLVQVDDMSFGELSAEEAAALRPVSPEPKGRAFPALDPARITEIASWLPAAPQGVGRPASDRAAWEKLAAMPEAEGVLKSAAAHIDTPPPEVPDELYLEFTTNGNRRNYERPYGQRSGRISALLLAECIEYQGRFLPALERDVMAVCEERSWTMPAHDGGLSNFKGTLLTIDLGSSARGWLLSSVDYWLGDRLSPEVRDRLRQEVKRRILDPYLEAVRSGDLRGNWWMLGNNNWNAVCTAGVVGTALALVDDPRDRAEFLAAMEKSNPVFISGFTDDGYCSEGMGYWNYGFGHYIMMSLIVRESTGGRLDIFQGEKIHRIAEYARGYQIQSGQSPHFADGGGNPGLDIWALLRQLYPEAVPNDAALPPLLRGGHVTVGLRAFGQEPPAPPAGEATRLPMRTWFPDAQVLISRARPESEVPFGAAIKGGHNAEHHNHNDVGSYAIMLDGVEMTGDPGGEVYTRRTFSRERYVSKVLNSYGHPVPVVAGKLQPTGRQVAARVLATEFSSLRDSITLDLTAAYPVPELSSLHRQFTYDRRLRAMEIIDQAEFTSPQTFSVPLVTYRKVFRSDATTLYFYDTKHCLRVKVAVAGGIWDWAEEEIENPSRPSPRRLAIRFELPVSTARVRFLFEPCEFPEDLPGIYREPKWGDLRPQPDRAIARGAGDFSAQTGGEVTLCEKPGATGQAFKFWDKEGHALEYTFEVPQAGTYAVQLRMCASANAPISRQVLVDGAPLAGVDSFLLPDTGGWSSTEDNWRDVYLSNLTVPATVELTPGAHVLRLVNDSGVGTNLNWVRLVPVEK